MSASSSTELRSPGLRRALLALAACAGLGAATAGCFVITDDGGSDPSDPNPTPVQESLDTGSTMTVPAGQGAGLFVEYLGDGDWDVFTSCDTDLTDRPCSFDVIISVGAGVRITGPELHDAEPVDALTLLDGGFRMTTGTASRLDGVRFQTDPGASIEVDMLLDGAAQPSFINWVSGGERVSGDETTGNPVDFVPTTP